MGLWVKIILFLIVVHLAFGFGWLIYKLSPRKKSDKTTNADE